LGRKRFRLNQYYHAAYSGGMKTPTLKALRMWDWLLVSAVLLIIIYHVKPELLPVDVHKVSLITMAAFVGYWIDRSAFPRARPSAFMARPYSPGGGYVPDEAVCTTQQLVFAACMIRRAIIIGSAILGVSLGL
jgi:hypothetical protein